MLRYFFSFILLVFLANPFFAQAQTTTLSGTECTALGGTCNSYYNTCGASEDLVGTCGGTFNNTGCCKAKVGAVTTSAECTTQGGTCNTLSQTCSSGSTSIGTCPGTVKDSACCSTIGANIGTAYTPLENVPFINGTTFQAYVEGIYRLGLVLIILSSVFMLVIGGFTYLTSAGNTAAISSAKHIITGALIGLVLALVSYIILNTINPDLVNVNVSTLQPVTTGGTVGSGGPGGGGGTVGGGTGGGGSCTPIPDSQLVTFPASATNGSPERALASTVANFLAMRAEALKVGIDLKVSDGYRSPDEQLAAWNGNGCNLVGGKTVCAKRTAAVPCSLGGGGSNHTVGTAVDITLTSGAYAWLQANGSQWGFKNALPNDRPHWSPTGK